MSRRSLFLVFLIAVFVPPVGAGEYKSGPQPGESIPGSFSPFNINGKYGKKVEPGGELVAGTHHCLVCEYDLKPVVMIFAREPKDDKLLMELLKKIDQAVAADKSATSSLHAFVVFLSPFGTDSVIEASLPDDKKTKDAAKLIDLSIGRKDLIARLDQRATQLKNVVVAYYPEEGPKGYHIDPKAEITVVTYVNLKVQKNFSFGTGQMTENSVNQIMQAVQELTAKGKKKETGS